MKFQQPTCPQCGCQAAYILEKLYAKAELIFDITDPNSLGGNIITPATIFEYQGGSDVLWNTQTRVLDPNGRVALECDSGHQWKTKELK